MLVTMNRLEDELEAYLALLRELEYVTELISKDTDLRKKLKGISLSHQNSKSDIIILRDDVERIDQVVNEFCNKAIQREKFISFIKQEINDALQSLKEVRKMNML